MNNRILRGCAVVLGVIGSLLVILLVVSLVITRGHPGFFIERTLHTVGILPRPDRPGYGVIGIVVRVEGANIIVNGRTGDEVTVVVEKDTIIEQVTPQQGESRRDKISLSNVQPGQGLIAFGRPDDQGRTHVHIVRIFDAQNWPPPPPSDRFFQRP